MLSLIDVTEEPAGENCYSGGYKIKTGIDLNNNNQLDENEVQNIEFVCNGISDKEIRLNFIHENDIISTAKITGYIGGAFLPKFNLDNYYDIDSIVFGAFLETYDISSKCIVELYDNSNINVIQGSQISTNSSTFQLVTTKINFLNNVPEGENDLTIKIRSEIDNTTVICHSAFIILYRK